VITGEKEVKLLCYEGLGLNKLEVYIGASWYLLLIWIKGYLEVNTCELTALL
jgi:hypothetical protein